MRALAGELQSANRRAQDQTESNQREFGTLGGHIRQAYVRNTTRGRWLAMRMLRHTLWTRVFQGAASLCVVRHTQRQLVCSVRGDFTVSGPCSSLDWFEAAMKNKYKLTVGGRLGPGPNNDKEISVLNRIIRWTPNGIQYEADPRQVQKPLREIELEGANGAVTPG